MTWSTELGSAAGGGGSGMGTNGDALYHNTYDDPAYRLWSPEVAMGGESLTANQAKNQITVSATGDITTISDLVDDGNGVQAGRDVFSLVATATPSFLRPSRQAHIHINTDSDWSFAAWYKASAAPAVGHYLAMHWVNDAWQANSSSFQITSAGFLTMQANGAGVVNLYTAASLCDGDWHSIVLRAKGLSVQVYIDGSLVNTATFTNTTTQTNHTMRYLYCDSTNAAVAANLVHFLYYVSSDWITAYNTAGPGGDLLSIDTVSTIPSPS